MAYEDDEDFYTDEPETTGDDDWEPPPPPEWEPPEPEPEPELEPPPLPATDEEDIENAPPYQVAGPAMPPPSRAAGAVVEGEGEDEWEKVPPGGFAPAAKDDEFEKVPAKQAAEDEWEVAPPGGFKPERGQEPRGLGERVSAGFRGGMGETEDPVTHERKMEPLGFSPENQAKYPFLTAFQPLIAPIDAIMRLPFGAIGAAAGFVAGILEKNPDALLPYGLNRTQADGVQRELDMLGKSALYDAGARAPTAKEALPTRPKAPLPRDEVVLPPEGQTGQLPLTGGATRTPDQMRLPLEPPPGDPFRMPQPELPLRTPAGEQGQLPMPGVGAPIPEGRVGRALPEVPAPEPARVGPNLPQERQPVGRPGTAAGELTTPPAPELPGPGGKIAEQTEMPLAPPTGREPAPLEPVRQGEMLPQPGEQGQLPFPHQEAPGTGGKTVAERESRGLPPVLDESGNVIRPGTERHGSPGSSAAAGTSEAQPPPVGPKPGEPGWLTQARGPEDYGKKPAPGAGGGGVNVGNVDPTVRGAITKEPIPQHLDQRPTGDLIRLARQGDLSDFMRQSLANELERRGIRRMPEPAGAEPSNVGQQLRNREETARRAAEESARAKPDSQNLPGPQKPGGNIVGGQLALPAPKPGPARPVAQPPGRGTIALPDRSLPQRPRTQTTSTAAPTTGRQFAPLREPPAPRAPTPAPTPKPVPKTVPHVTGTGKSVPLTVVNRHSLRDILDQHSGNKGLIEKLTDFVRGKVQDRAGNVHVYVVADKDFYGRGVYAGRPGIKGYYSPMLDHIVIPERVVTGAEKYLAPQIMLHEGLHAATYKAVQSSPQLQTALQGIMRDVVSKRTPETRYGFTNVHEFITEGFTNPKFQMLLKDHTLSPAAAAKFRQQMGSPVRNAWDAMVQTVRSILGVPKGATNALEAMMRVSGKAMEMKPGTLRNTPLRVEAERPGGAFRRAEGMTSEAIRAELAKTDLPRVQRAVFNDILRGRGEKIEAVPTTAVAGGGKPPPSGPPPKGPAGPAAASAGPPSKGAISPARQAIRDRIAPDPTWTDHIPKNFREAAELVHRGYEGVFNAMHPYARAASAVERALERPLNREEDFHRLARTIKGLGGKLESIYREGAFDPETRKVIGPALDPILKKIMVDQKAFVEYAIAKRAIEKEAQGVKTGVPLKEANQTVAELGGKWGPVLKELNEFNSSMLRMAKHLIGDEGIAKIEALNKDYIPMYRALDPKSEMGDMFRTGGGLSVKDPIEKMKGSERQFQNPLNSTLKNTAMLADLAEKNEVHRAMERANDALVKAGKDPIWQKSRSDSPVQILPEQRQRMLDAGIPADMVEKMRFVDAKQYAPESGKIRFFENGKEQIRDVNKDIARVAAGMDRPMLGLTWKILGTPARMLRGGSTLTPEFGVKNIFRDQATGFIQSTGVKGYIPFYDAAMSLERFFKPEVAKEFNKWMREGGANSNLVSFDRKLLTMEPRSFYGKLENVVVHPHQIPRMMMDLLRGFSEQLENATRFGGHMRNVKEGVASSESAFRQREMTVDFGRMGNYQAIRIANALIPFFNANVQGLDRFTRAFAAPRGVRQGSPAHLAAASTTFVKTMAAITVPSVALWMLNKDDPRYNELPQWQKMLFWIFPTNDWRNVTPAMEKKLRADNTDAWFRKDPQTGAMQYNHGTLWRLPKPFAEGQIFGSIPERIMESYLQHKPNAMKHVADSVIDALAPSAIPQAVVPWLEQQSNWSRFLKRPLMSEQAEKKPQAQQFTAGTSETAKLLASAVRSVAGDKPSGQLGSPIIIDNYIRQLTGGLGNHVVSGIDKAINALSGKEKDTGATPERTWADIPGIKGFVARFPDRGAQSIQDFYDLRKEGQTAKAGGDKGAWTGDETAKRLKGYRDAIEKFNTDKDMSAADKRTAIDVTTLMMIEAAKRGITLGEKAGITHKENVEKRERIKRERQGVPAAP